ncbi:MAG: polysaccharide deacetylase family protein [Thermoleophilia bacterium]
MPAAVPILTFHGLESPRSLVGFPPALFRRCLARIAERGWRVVPLLDLVGCLERREPLPDRSLALTFDDGYASVARHALPALAEHGMPATLFVLGGTQASLHGRPLLDRGALAEAVAAGHAIGAHSLTHPDLTRLAPAAAEREIAGSRAALEDALAVPVEAFAYPRGRHDARVCELVGRCFRCGCSDRLGLAGAGSDLLALPRVETWYLARRGLVDLVGSPLLPAYVAARAVPRGLRRAVRA